jgi:hypothetical protein
MEIAVRAYTKKKDKNRRPKQNKSSTKPDYRTFLAFDTETTIDEYQNLRLGSCILYNEAAISAKWLFYNSENVNEEEYKELLKYCNEHAGVTLITLGLFIETVFYPYVFDQKIPVVGFNLPFDLSRLAKSYVESRGNMEGGFTLKLCDHDEHPPIRIKHNSPVSAFIKFQATRKSLSKSHKGFKGYFIDCKTLAVAITDEKHMKLEIAAERFNKIYKKLQTNEHGRITQDYLQYNFTDTLATGELFMNLLVELNKYGVGIDAIDVFSPASIGKACLKSLGIMPHSHYNSMPAKMKGKIMTTYFGGRCECRIRDTPVKVTVLDFTSMYPSMFNVGGLYDFLIADKIDYKEDTESAITLLESIQLNDLRNQDTWKKLNMIVELSPEEDILPVRAKYDEKTFNIGINFLSSDKTLTYTLSDIIVSKLLTGKIPKIKQAWRFFPIGKQKTLKKRTILGIEINPSKENLFKRLVELKQDAKLRADPREKGIKVLLNSTSYGIFVQLDVEGKSSDLVVYSTKKFETSGKYEEPGEFFDPIIASLITGHSRLVLGIIEAILARKGTVHAYCDTDSMFVPPETVEEIQDFFRPLNPYSNVKELFKIEGKDWYWFYGLSSKRYVLYRKEGSKITIDESKNDEDYSLHGLGHLLNPFGDKEIRWQKIVWEDILKLHYKINSEDDFRNKYMNFYALSQFAVSSFGLIGWFSKINQDKPLSKQIKPFNFMLMGMSKVKDVKPIAPFSKNSNETVYKPFVNRGNGQMMEGVEYWKTLSDELWRYVKHPEHKFDGYEGILHRKHIVVDKITSIGKEANNVEKALVCLNKLEQNIYTDQKELEKLIRKMTVKDAERIGMNTSTLWKAKKRVRNRKPIHFSKKIRDKLLKY